MYRAPRLKALYIEGARAMNYCQLKYILIPTSPVNTFAAMFDQHQAI
jgi:hypothetical protein